MAGRLGVITPHPQERLRHVPSGREGVFVKESQINGRRYYLCQHVDKGGSGYLAYLASEWEMVSPREEEY